MVPTLLRSHRRSILNQAIEVNCKMPDGLQAYILTEHAREEMQRRGISEALVATVLRAPGQRWAARQGRDVFQTVIDFGDPPTAYVVRVFVDIDRMPAEVVTVYRSSKVSKYWR